MSNETPAVAVKDSTFKGKGKKFEGKNRPFISEKGTSPYNDVAYFDDKKKEYVIIKGISDAQKVAEGSMAPLQHQNDSPVKDKDGNILRYRGRFEKDMFERKETKRLKRIYKYNQRVKGKQPTASMGGTNYNEPKSTLIVHLANFRRGKDFKDFKTTYSFPNVKESEIFQVLSTIVRLNRNKENDRLLNYVNKYYFNGSVYHGQAKTKNG